MIRRDRLRGHTFVPAPGLTASVRRSCRDELKIVYEAERLPLALWESLAVLGTAEIFRASAINPAMKDLFRVKGEALRFEGAVEGTALIAFFRGRGRLRARHLLEQLLKRWFDSESRTAPP